MMCYLAMPQPCKHKIIKWHYYMDFYGAIIKRGTHTQVQADPEKYPSLQEVL
jgi:hypothetical protein